MIYIIGAGPIGSYAAKILSKNQVVKVFEQKKEIGNPVQCTGIFTNKILKYIPKDAPFILNRPNNSVIVAPNKKSITIKSKKKDIVVDRSQFDKYFFEKAKNSKNVRVYLEHELVKISERSIVFMRKDSNKKVSYPLKKGDIVIGADGPTSKIYKFINTKRKKNILGIQYIIKHKHDGNVQFHPHKKSLDWIVPETKNTIRAGCMGKVKKENLDNFLKEYIPNFEKNKLEEQGGLIPIFDPKINFFKRIKNKQRDLRVYLIGDAGNFVKATTGGGIIPGLESAKLLKKSIKENKNYNKLVKKEIAPGLKLHLLAHKVFMKFSNKDWNKLVKIFNQKKLKNILKNIDRDNSKVLALKLILAKPSLLKYMKYLKK